MNLHLTGNLIESILWAVIGCGFIWRAIRAKRTSPRTRCLIAAGAFWLFGLSDVIEIYTGAWWRPWWLLLMKVICVLTLIRLYIDYRFRQG